MSPVNFFKILLFPFAILYFLITSFRNYLFDIGYKKSIRFEVPVINVGNLIAGGAGKTPMVEYLINTLSNKYQMATLSRGYGRRTRGFILASDKDNATTIGDEPFQLYHKYNDKVEVAVGEERALAIPEILFKKPETNLILLDDAFQHRMVTPGFSILLTEYSRPFYRDYILPIGLLRESRRGAKRADLIVVTKCPENIKEEEINEIRKKIAKYAPGKDIYFTTIQYSTPTPFFNSEFGKIDRCIQLSGIANPMPFQAFLESKYRLVEKLIFPDHYKFTKKDIDRIFEKISKYSGEISVLTTEKDYVRLLPFTKELIDSAIPFYYVPIESQFLFDKNKFDKTVSDAIIAVQRENND